MYAAARPSLPVLDPLFADILRSEINVVSIPRAVEPELADEIREVAARCDFLHEGKLDTHQPDARSLVQSIPNPRVAAFLVDDIGFLAQQLGALLGRRHVHADLSIQRTDGCPKIHADNVSVRVLCTYAGPGTDWLPNDDLVRDRLGCRDMDTAAANRSMVRTGASLRRCAPGEVLLLKGEAFPGNRGRGAAHRSPPLGSSGAARLLLRIDEHRCGC